MATKITTVFLLSFFYFSTFASSPTPFWSENFINGIPNSWSTEDETNNGVEWGYCEGFLTCLDHPAYDEILPDDWFRSGSFEDGYAMVTPIENGASNDLHRSILMTPIIDCSDKDEVYVQFNTFIVAKESEIETEALLQIKIGNSDWENRTIFFHFNADQMEEGKFGFQSYNPHTAFIDISDLAANQEDVQIRWLWKFEGSEELFWGIDDVELLDTNPLYERAVWGAAGGESEFAGSLGNWSVTGNNLCAWSWDENGLIDTPDSNEEADFYVNSNTIENGAAVLNASTCYPELIFSEIISPAIDLSSLPAGTPLNLTFHQTGALGNANPDAPGNPLSKVLVSLDGGLSYPHTLVLNEDKVYHKVFNETASIPLPDEAAGTAELRVKFSFEGTTIFWAIDDVRVVERYENDLEIYPLFYSVAPNYSTPAFAVQPIAFAAEVKNVGSSTQDFATVYVDVIKDFSTEVVFRDTLFIGSLSPGEIATGHVFEKTFTPDKWRQKYTVRYRVEADEEDEQIQNNSIYWKFEVTEDLFSKNKGPSSINGSFWPSGQIDYEIGNCFFVPPGAGLRATNVNFAFGNKTNIWGAKLILRLYKWKTDNTFADENQDTIANTNEFDPVAFNEFNTAVFTNEFDPLNKVYSHPISFDSPSVELEDSIYYFVTIEYTDDNTPQAIFPIAASEEIDYTSMFWQSFQTDLPQYTSMLKENNGGFRANSWGLKRIPYIQLEVEEITTQIEQPEADTNVDIALYPNPAGEWVRVELPGEGLASWLQLELYDIHGQMIWKKPIENQNVSHIPISTSELSNGSYILRVVSENKTKSKLFSVFNQN